MNKKAQGALEYLLLIGGAVLVASIVIALITGTTAGQKDPRAMAKCAPLTNCSTCLTTVPISADNQCQAVITTVAGTERTVDVGVACSIGAGETFKYCGTKKTV